MDRIIKKVESAFIKTNLPELSPGDNVKVILKVVEEGKTRLQVYQGVIISIQGEGMGKTIKVRKISYGVGVERVFPLHSPNIDSIEIIKRGAPRRAKLFYLRERVGKRALKVKTKTRSLVDAMGDTTVDAVTENPAPVSQAPEAPESVKVDTETKVENPPTEEAKPN